MTKTLTEQWREGTLACGDYYIKTKGLGIDKIIINYYEEELKQFDGLCDCSVAEVLDPVPSYDKVKETSQKIKRLEHDNDAFKMTHNHLVQKLHILEKKLEIATKALKRIDPPNIIFDDYRNSGIELWEIAHNALKEMEGVK